MSDGDFPAIDGNALGEMCGVNIDRATISYLLGSVKWLADENRYYGDAEDIYETTQAFEQFARRLMAVTNESECVEFVTIPPGTINPYIGTDAPSGWLKCNGSTYDQIDYPDLVAKLPASLRNDIAGTFVTPDFRGKMPVGVDPVNAMFPLASTGGEVEHFLIIDELPAHTHVQNSHNHTQNAHTHVQDAHNHTQNSHNHTQNAHTHVQDAHNHTQNAHTHVQDAHTHVQDSHSHTVTTKSGGTAFGTTAPTRGDSSGVNANSNTSSVTATNQNTTATNQNTTATNNAATATNQNTTATNNAATATNNAATATNQNTTATNNAATATNQNTGSDLAHNNMPPYFAVNWLIKT